MNNLDKQYIELIKHVLDNGYDSGDRTGTGTRKSFGNLLSHNMKEGFPILTTKKMFTKGIIYELLWFLRGETNIKYMVDNDVYIWVGDCYKKYTEHFADIKNFEFAEVSELQTINSENNNGVLLTSTVFEPLDRASFINAIKEDKILSCGKTFSQKWGELNKVYGAEWVHWDDNINQIQELIDTLNTNPNSRRMMVTAWNPTNVKKALLPPCHYAFQVFTRELTFEERFDLASNLEINENYMKMATTENLDAVNVPKREISLMFNMRSVDVGLGLPFDISSYGFLLSMIAQVVNMVPGELKCILADTHIYNDHIEPIQEHFNRVGSDLPRLKLNRDIKNIFDFKFEDLEIIRYDPDDVIKLPLSN